MKSCVLLLATALAANATVVSNQNIGLSSNVFYGGPGDGFADYSLTIEQYPPPGGSDTSIFFDRDGGNLVFRSMNLDGGSYWYFATLNDVFSGETIGQGGFTLFNQYDQSFAVPLGPFYFGVRTFSDFGENIQGFGWALLNNTGTDLQLVSSAITYDSPGIIVGTLTTVPEPGGLPLVAVAVGLAMRRRRS
ncbi:MAG: PEP-CTERM sorting domain-containing protein [Verrucomicrobiae bacterium]|nr:PEP-CTERM sorting domain-containing protein [Verrucomicrobiae bacterium]